MSWSAVMTAIVVFYVAGFFMHLVWNLTRREEILSSLTMNYPDYADHISSRRMKLIIYYEMVLAALRWPWDLSVGFFKGPEKD